MFHQLATMAMSRAIARHGFIFPSDVELAFFALERRGGALTGMTSFSG